MQHTRAALVAAAVLLAALAGAVGPAAAAGGAHPATASPGAAQSAVAAGAGAAAQDDCSFPVTETDATGTDVTLEEAPETVVVTAPSAAQTIWELGEQERVVGMPVTDASAYLEGSQNRTHVLDESGVHPDREAIVELDPDLVIAPGVTSEDDVESLRDAGLTVYYEGDSGSIEDVRENVRTTGRLLGACEAAASTVDWMDERLASVEDAVADEDRPSVYYWLGEGFTAPPGSFQHDLLERAGARNAAENMEMEGWSLADEEQIVEEDPEYLLLQEGTDVPDNEAIQATTAVQEDNVIYVDANYWNQNAPRVVLAVEQIAEQLHPEAFEAGANASVDAPGDDNATGEDDAAAADGDDSDEIPGFGVAPAVAAVLALAVALWRRE